MTPTTDTFRIAHLTELEHFQRCVELQVLVWGYADGDVIPQRVFTIASRIGGQVIGAFDGATMVAFAMSLPGLRDGGAYMHSHMLAVLPQYRNTGLGRRLKLAQREDALARGIRLMEWTFDPLEIKNSYLNITRLGAIARRYHPDFYGASSSPLQGGLPTDRLYAEWHLDSPRVRAALREAESGSIAPPPMQVLTTIAVPKIVSEWKRDPDQRKLAEALQTTIRTDLESAFARSLAVIGYDRGADGDGTFLLGPATGLD